MTTLKATAIPIALVGLLLAGPAFAQPKGWRNTFDLDQRFNADAQACQQNSLTSSPLPPINMGWRYNPIIPLNTECMRKRGWVRQ